jgi:isochorismate synthase
MNKTAVLSDFLKQTIRNGHSLAVWFLPDSDELCWISANAAKTITGTDFPDFEKTAGFIFYPFSESETPPLFLASAACSQGFADMKAACIATSMNDPALAQKPENLLSTAKEDYIRSLEKIIPRIKAGEVQKVVISKIKIITGREELPSALFLQLKARYPSAFCWMFYTAESGLWAGATPEVLLTTAKGITTTMALAGSRKAEATQQPWPEKEQHEQQLVTDYIVSSLKNLGIHNPATTPAYTTRAGNIDHIRTDISFRQEAVSSGAIASTLHPTPAVCGFPKSAALEIIRSNERHQREYYTGFLGPVNFDGASQLYVNLRCAKIWNQHYQLFTGGGITAQSNPEAEWEETELKTQTMLNAIHDASKL